MLCSVSMKIGLAVSWENEGEKKNQTAKSDKYHTHMSDCWRVELFQQWLQQSTQEMPPNFF